MRIFGVIVWLVLFCAGVPGAAISADDHVVFSFPVACEIGKTCWIPNYVDLKPGPGVLDYACGDASYDAEPGGQHKGTDIAVQDMAAMREGVPVVAAADGVVISQRDGVPDINVKDNPKGVVDSMACGNGLRIEHANGFISQYCHMRNHTIFAFKGDKVRRGQHLGTVGLSGRTQFPHLHFQVTKDNQIIDPFAGLNRVKPCGVGETPLWDAKTIAATPYQPTAIYNIGFSQFKPDFKAISNGLYKATTFATTVPALVVWAEVFRVKAGDKLEFTITDPSGRAIHQNAMGMKAAKASYVAFSGLKRKGTKWPVGTYQGKVTLKRGSKEFVATTALQIQ
jgi:hypothetical protein